MGKSSKKKIRRLFLTHFEVRRGNTLRLRIAIADEAFAEVGDELGALFRKLAPSAVSPVAIPVVSPPSPPPSPPEFMIEHTPDDDAYHRGLRDRLIELFSTLCDASLADALEIAREERARRSDGGN